MVKIENKDLKLKDIPVDIKDLRISKFAKTILKNNLLDPIILCQKATKINKTYKEMNLTELRIVLFFYCWNGRWFTSKIVENNVSKILSKIREKVIKKEFD